MDKITKAIEITKISLLIYLLPVLEVLLMRKVTNINSTASALDLFLPAVLLTLFIYRHKEALKIRLQIPVFLINLILLPAYLWLVPRLTQSALNNEPGLYILYGLAVLVLFSSFFSMVSLFEFGALVRQNLRVCVFGAILSCSRLFYGVTQVLIWKFMSDSVTFFVYHVLVFLGYEMIPTDERFMLMHDVMPVKIASACSGIEGIFFFIPAFSFILLLDPYLYSKTKIVVTYVLGILYMYVLNILRITVFFMAGIWAIGKWGKAEGSQMFVDLFHNNVGWIFYSVGIVFFLFVFLRLQRGQSPVGTGSAPKSVDRGLR